MAVQITSCGGLGTNPLSEMGRRTGDTSIPSLQQQSNLPKQALLILFNNGAAKNLNVHAGHLYILVKGWDAIGKSFSYHSTLAPFAVTKETYNDFINKDNGILANCGLLELCKKTCPAGKNGQLNDLGRLGLFSRLTGFQITNPMTGPATHLPPGVKEVLDQQHSGFTDALQNICESINTHSYLRCFAVGTYGGIQEALHSITHTIQDFYAAMFDVYKDMQLMFIQAQMVIQQYIADLEYWFTHEYLSLQVQLFLAVACALLSAMQTLIDDVAFFAGLFNGSDALYSALNAVQTVVNIGSQAINYIYHPISAGLPALFPKEAQQVLDFINNLGNVPANYFGTLIKHFSFGKSMNNKGVAIANSIIQRYGLGAQLGDLWPMMQSFGCAVPAGNWHRTSAPSFKGPISFKMPTIPYDLKGKVDPSRYSLLQFDAEGKPSITMGSVGNSMSNLWQDVKNDFSNLAPDAAVLEKDLSKMKESVTNLFVSDRTISG